MKIFLPYFKTLIVLMVISLPFIGTDCNNSTTVTNSNIQASWRLVNSTGGTLHDICPGETADFQSNGVAILTCPQQSPVNRNYTISNSVLTFTDTQVQYNASLSNNNNTLTLNGTGSVSGRILEYNKLNPASNDVPVVTNKNIIKNSSEK